MMHKNLKLWLILAAVLIVIGLILIVIPMSIYKWDFSRLNAVPFETNTHTPQASFHSITLNTDTADISILPSPDNTCKVVCHEPEDLKHTVEVLDGILTIQEVDTQKWHTFLGLSFGSSKITLYLPNEAYTNLTIRESTGDIQIEKDLTFAGMDIQTSTGDVETYASASGVMKIKTSTGSISIETVSAAVLDLAVSTGKITVTDTTCENLTSTGDTGDITLKNVIAAESIQIERSTGDITFDSADAADILVKTDTGDVTGMLLTEKVFDVETDTGSVNIPKSGNGGNCVIHTDTGDIELTVG